MTVAFPRCNLPNLTVPDPQNNSDLNVTCPLGRKCLLTSMNNEPNPRLVLCTFNDSGFCQNSLTVGSHTFCKSFLFSPNLSDR